MNIFAELGVSEEKKRLNEAVIYNIAGVYSLISGFISRLLSPYGLTPAKFNILLMVKHIGKRGGLPQNKISSLLVVTTSNMTRMVDKLEKDKYVERIAQEGDRRVNRIRITKKGSQLLDSVWPEYKKNVDLLMKALSDSEKKQMNKLLEKIKSRVEEIEES